MPESEAQESGDTTRNQAMAEAVATDTSLDPTERETTLQWGKTDERASVYSVSPSVVRALLEHRHFEVDELTMKSGDCYVYAGPDHWDGQDILAVKGSIPIGCLKVKPTPRNESHDSLVVSNHDPGGGD